MNWSPRSTNAIERERPRSRTSSKIRSTNASASSTSPTSTATWLIPTARAIALSVSLGLRPDAEELDDHGGCGGHVLDARPLAHGVVLLAAREEVRGRQPQ